MTKQKHQTEVYGEQQASKSCRLRNTAKELYVMLDLSFYACLFVPRMSIQREQIS